MIPNAIPPIKVYDGESEVLLSETFNIFENKLQLTNILSYTFELTFTTDKDKKESTFTSTGNPAERKVLINFINFGNVLGTATTAPFPVLNLPSEKKLFLSVFAKSLSETTPFLQVSVTFTIK